MRMVISVIVALFFFLGAASRNITPDAVTRATIWNSHEGDPDVLGDGKVPQDADALPFTWKTKGILVFAWRNRGNWRNCGSTSVPSATTTKSAPI